MTGTYALFVCDRCGWAYPYTLRVKEPNGSVVCPECNDGIFNILTHPQNKSADLTEDISLKDARPETVLATTGDSTWTPSQTVGAKGGHA